MEYGLNSNTNIKDKSLERQELLLALLNKINESDEQALSDLYDHCIDQVYNVAFAILKNDADSEEIVCDVFEYVWRKATFYAPEKSKVISWLLMICRSKSIDLIRKRKVSHSYLDEQELLNLEDSDLKPDELMARFQQNEKIHSQLNSLNDVQKQVLSMAYFKDLSHLEIANSLGLPLGTVKSHIRRATNTLKDVIKRDN